MCLLMTCFDELELSGLVYSFSIIER
jgi:hypothetical protein